jgi:DNA-binding Lrp family transcriptional regulator/copper chaperone CopZ
MRSPRFCVGDLMNLDDLDFGILRELGGSNLSRWNVRESYSDIARKLGVDEETVRARVKKASERGLIPAWRIMVNPLLIDCREAHLEIEVRDEERKAEAVSKIKGLDGVYGIVDFLGKEIAVLTYYEDNDSLAREVKQMESICGSQRLALLEKPSLRPSLQMRRLDWRIIGAMREDAWRDLDDVAKLLGVSLRTVQRRLSAMRDGKAIYLLRPPNAEAVAGLMCQFLVFADPGKKRAADYVIHSTFNRIGSSDTSPEQFSTFGISCQNYSEADRVTEKLKAIDGVKSVRMRVVKEIIVVQDWVRNEIEKRVSAP